MNVWKNIAVPGIILVALAGCTKVELAPVPEKEVSFTVGSYAAQTKSVSLDTYGITEFQSRGFLHAHGVAETQEFFGISGETIRKQSTLWAPASHPYYWPKSEVSYVNFVSWYGKHVVPTTVSETSLVWDNCTIEPDEDILFADEAWRYNSNNVTTLFHHALAQVKFQARLSKAAEGKASWSVTLSNFRVSNVHKTGTLRLQNSDPGTARTTKPWTVAPWTTTAATDTLSREGKTFTLGASNQILMDSRTVLPQGTYGMVLTFDYTIHTHYDSGNPLSSTAENAHASIDMYLDFGLHSWGMNESVTYTIVINPDTNIIVFEPTLTEAWNTDQNNPMYIE